MRRAGDGEEMRRVDREVTEFDRIVGILDQCKVCRVGLNDEGEVYIVPMNFGYSLDGEDLTLYFHCAKEGRRMDILKTNPTVGFEMDCNHNLVEADTACRYSFKYASIIGTGEACFIENPKEKMDGFHIIMKHQTGKEFEFNEQMVAPVTMFKVRVRNYCCKEQR